MSKQEKIKLVDDLVKHLKTLDKKYEKTNNLFGDVIQYFENFWHLQDFAVRLVADKIDDDGDWLQWWIECYYDGQARLGNKGRWRRINTTAKLIDFIEEVKS